MTCIGAGVFEQRDDCTDWTATLWRHYESGRLHRSSSPDGQLGTFRLLAAVQERCQTDGSCKRSHSFAPKPVTFHYKSDTKGTPQFGLVAEEVAEVNSDLVRARRRNGEIYTVDATTR